MLSLRYYCGRQHTRFFSNSPGKPTPSVFSALTFCPCRQCRTLCRSGWIVCVGSKAAVSIWCPYILCMWHLLIGHYRPSSPSGWRDHHVDHSAMPSIDQQHEYIHVITEDHSNMATVICARVNVVEPTPARRHLVTVSRLFCILVLPFYLSEGQSCHVC